MDMYAGLCLWGGRWREEVSSTPFTGPSTHKLSAASERLDGDLTKIADKPSWRNQTNWKKSQKRKSHLKRKELKEKNTKKKTELTNILILAPQWVELKINKQKLERGNLNNQLLAITYLEED